MERGHLVVEDGIGGDRRKGRLSRLDRDLKRVVIIGHAGTITLDAVRWLVVIVVLYTAAAMWRSSRAGEPAAPLVTPPEGAPIVIP